MLPTVVAVGTAEDTSFEVEFLLIDELEFDISLSTVCCPLSATFDGKVCSGSSGSDD